MAIERVKAERQGITEVLDSMDWRKIWRGVSSPLTVTISVIFLLNNVTVQVRVPSGIGQTQTTDPDSLTGTRILPPHHHSHHLPRHFYHLTAASLRPTVHRRRFLHCPLPMDELPD